MNIENKSLNMDKDQVITSLVKLLNDSEAIKNIIIATNPLNVAAAKIKYIIKLLSPIVDQAQKGELKQINIDTIVLKIWRLNYLIDAQKNMNPLIPDELITIVYLAKKRAIDIQSFLKKKQ
jgi:hypothetical protein